MDESCRDAVAETKPIIKIDECGDIEVFQAQQERSLGPQILVEFEDFLIHRGLSLSLVSGM
eukprot:1909067-Rhodomonas_salina.2